MNLIDPALIQWAKKKIPILTYDCWPTGSFVSMPTTQSEATHGIVEKDLLEAMMRVWYEYGHLDKGKKKIVISVVTQCPECGDTQEWESKEEAEKFSCPCSPIFPEMQCFQESRD